MTRQRMTAVGAVIGGLVMAIVVVAQTPDPRVAALEQIIGSVSQLKDSTPPLNDAAQIALSSAITSLRTAQAAIPPIPPPPGTGTCGEPITEWHPPVVNGCATGHEHGDAPPEWATAFAQAGFGHGVIYGGDEASSAAENSHKHQAFKGITARSVAGGDVYLRYHAASNPLDRSARYHSYELYYRDTSGGVSFWQGWYDTGDPNSTRSRCLRRSPTLACENTRPIILVADEASFGLGAAFEQWYAHATGKWSWDLGIAIGNATTYYRRGENSTAMDATTWILSGDLGLTRRVDGFWYLGRDGGGTTLVGDFCATAMGQVVDCMDPGGLAQHIASTARNDAREEFGQRRVSFLVQKRFPGQGVRLPN